MTNNLMYLLAGLCLIYLGFEVILTGGHRVRGFPSHYSDPLRMPVGLIFIIVGGFFIIFTMLKNSNKK